MIKATGVDHVVLHVSDVGRSKAFYTDILGTTVYLEDDGQVFMHAGQQGVALFKKQGETPLAAGNDLNHLALHVAAGNYETLKSELEKAGLLSAAVRERSVAYISRTPTAIGCS